LHTNCFGLTLIQRKAIPDTSRREFDNEIPTHSVDCTLVADQTGLRTQELELLLPDKADTLRFEVALQLKLRIASGKPN
jgi:hypothetical protein